MNDGKKSTIVVASIVSAVIAIICTSFHGEVLP